MSAYLVANVRVKDPQKWSAYTKGARGLLEEYGGSLVVFDQKPTVLVGEDLGAGLVILEFPSKDILQRWFTSDAYKLLVPIREEGADVTFIAAE
ncbi:MAG: DUF1330 domain-containing protein [Sneathiella sp.]